MRIAILLLAALLSGCAASQAEMIEASRQRCLAFGVPLEDKAALAACTERGFQAATAPAPRTNVVVNNSNPRPVTCGPAFC